MGGFGSGRARQHTSINNCLTIDTPWLRNHKMLPGQQSHGRQQCEMEWKKWREVNFGKRTEQSYHILARLVPGEEPALLLHYQVEQVSLQGIKKQRDHLHLAPLISTPCHYGSVRWWFSCNLCYRRVRVLYIDPTCGNVEHMIPLCRLCTGLHYASQQQSYQEAHKAYERHLLRNYGYAWAEMEYHGLRKHYQEITPELEYARQCSLFEMRLRMLRLLMGCTRALLRTHTHQLRSMRSKEDRRVYLEHIIETHGERYAQDLVRLLGISLEMERTARQASTEVFDQAYLQMTEAITENLASEEYTIDLEPWESSGGIDLSLRDLLIYKQGLEEERARLKQVKPAA